MFKYPPVTTIIAIILLLPPLSVMTPEYSRAEYKGDSKSVSIVNNTGNGLWSEIPDKYLTLASNLQIGVEEGKEEYVFGRIFDVTADSRGNIYVLDNGYGRIQKYDQTGRFVTTLSVKGQGPGEMYFPSAITTDWNDNLYIAGNGKICIYDEHGVYRDEFAIGIQGGFARSLRTDVGVGIIVSCFEVFDQKIVHTFGFDYEPLGSFCDSYAVGKDVDVRIEQTFAGGAIDVDTSGDIYYTQMTPYEIRKFSASGTLLQRIFRENDFMTPPVVTETRDGMMFKMPPASYSIVVLEDVGLLNVVQIPGNDKKRSRTVIDLFDRDGNLLDSKFIEKSFQIRCSSSDNALYAIDYDDYPSISRYNLVIN